MTDAEKQETPKENVEGILAEFDARQGLLTAFCARTKSLIEASLQDANIDYQSVQFRVKTKTKLREKYLDPKKDYRRLDDITDLAGLRVITYYEDDVDRVSEVIEREFDIDRENSVDKRESEPDRFGYNAVNYVCRHQEKRTSDVEYKKFAGMCCEIQITSILRHAWSEIEHEWYDLKDSYPKNIKRRFYRIAALLELAESEFLDIKKTRTQFQRSLAVRVGANVPDLAVSPLSLRSFILQEPLVAEIDQSIARVLDVTNFKDPTDRELAVRSKIVNLAGMTKLQDLRDSLKKYERAIPEYVRRCKLEIWSGSVPWNTVGRGSSIHHLVMLMVNLRGAEATVRFRKSMKFRSTLDNTRLAAIAKEVVAKYTS